MQHSETTSTHYRLYYSCVSIGLSLLVLAVYVGVTRYRLGDASHANAFLMLVMAITTTWVFYRFRLLLSARSTSYMLTQGAWRWLQVVLFTSLIYAFVPDATTGVTRPVLWWWAGLSLPLVLCALSIMRRTAVRFYASGDRRRTAVFIEPGHESLLLADRILRSPVLGIEVKGYFGTAAAASLDGRPVAVPRLGSIEEAYEQISNNAYDIAFLAPSVFNTDKWNRIMDRLGDSSGSIYIVPEGRMLGYFQITGGEIAGVPLLSLHGTQILGMARIVKRFFDICLSMLAIILLSPVLVASAAAVALTSRGPILFRQMRYGQKGRAFHVYKFRSMYVHEPDGTGLRQAQRGDPRITPVGRILRRTSIDELPQLFNVLKGDMSLVGPRPHASEHNELYRKQIPGYMLRHTVKPGITGWAQVNGLRGETDTVDKMMKRVQYDRYYIQNWTLMLDMKILVRTVLLVLFDRAAY